MKSWGDAGAGKGKGKEKNKERWKRKREGIGKPSSYAGRERRRGGREVTKRETDEGK